MELLFNQTDQLKQEMKEFILNTRNLALSNGTVREARELMKRILKK